MPFLKMLWIIITSIAVVYVYVDMIGTFVTWYKYRYLKMKRFYEEHKNDVIVGGKMPMGFKTEKEREEIQDRLNAKRGA